MGESKSFKVIHNFMCESERISSNRLIQNKILFYTEKIREKLVYHYLELNKKINKLLNKYII